jgi:hypothetical protein
MFSPVRGSKQFFFEKKNQKTFTPAGFCNSRASAHRSKSFFGYFFFKKSNGLLFDVT